MSNTILNCNIIIDRQKIANLISKILTAYNFELINKRISPIAVDVIEMVIEIADFVLPVSAQKAFHLFKLRLAFGVATHEIEALPIEVKLFKVYIVFGS